MNSQSHEIKTFVYNISFFFLLAYVVRAAICNVWEPLDRYDRNRGEEETKRYSPQLSVRHDDHQEVVNVIRQV